MSYHHPNSTHRRGAPAGWSQRLILAALALTIVLPFAGCHVIRAFDETAALTWRDFVWSRRAYTLRYGTCDQPYAEHFRNGFCAGYEDVSNGGDGYVPALPPEEYRSYEYQSADGSKCVDAWFKGYPAGVAAAREDKTGDHHNVRMSRLIEAAIQQDESEVKLPEEQPVSGRRRLGVRSGENNSPLASLPSVMVDGVGGWAMGGDPDASQNVPAAQWR